MAENGCYVSLYFQASFKGVAFDAMEVSSEHGRRGAEGEFPFGEQTAYADLGRRIRRYNLSGRFPNNAHIDSASALIAAVESPGPGLLVHPTRGAALAACVKLTVKDNPLEEQGVTYIDMEFVEANSVATGLSLSVSLFGIDLAGLTLAIGATFAEYYILDNVRFYRIPNVQATVAEGMAAIRTEFQKTVSLDPTAVKYRALDVMQSIEDDPASLREATDAFTAFKRATRTLANATEGQVKYNSFKTIANKMAQVSSLPEEAGEAENAIFMMTRLLAVTNMVQAALETEVTTLDAALTMYEDVATIIDQEKDVARENCDDNLYLELRKLEADAKSALLARAYQLPTLVEYDFHGKVPSLVAAYAIFDDAKRFAELEVRNPNQWPFAIGPKVIAPRV